jgi:hypothetical protein
MSCCAKESSDSYVGNDTEDDNIIPDDLDVEIPDAALSLLASAPDHIQNAALRNMTNDAVIAAVERRSEEEEARQEKGSDNADKSERSGPLMVATAAVSGTLAVALIGLLLKRTLFRKKKKQQSANSTGEPSRCARVLGRWRDGIHPKDVFRLNTTLSLRQQARDYHPSV